MSCTDFVDSWTCAPGCLSPSKHGHVRMMTLTGEDSTEIILDSGADTSALPLEFGHVGSSCKQSEPQSYVDAQGGKL